MQALLKAMGLTIWAIIAISVVASMVIVGYRVSIPSHVNRGAEAPRPLPEILLPGAQDGSAADASTRRAPQITSAAGTPLSARSAAASSAPAGPPQAISTDEGGTPATST